MSWELFEKVKELGLPSGSYAIFGSGPMAVRGLRECRDIDLVVTDELFEEYKSASGWELKDAGGKEMLAKDGIEMAADWGPGEWDVEQLIEDADIIENLPFVRLAEVLRWKKLLKREKDLKDIEIIEDYFKKQGVAKSEK
ncbi:hypothetical protein M1413_01400 [Patescibacteria group bacterium]|jgi:hypothetical protein|nr:hypothetical protein [Patescibacteria group bacterium]MCL5114360.1 hypothetical protein [Patescibacteria group bacterium]